MSQSLATFIEKNQLTDQLLPASQTQGFITAMAAAPYPVNPSEWITFFWGNENSAPFASAKQLEQFVDIIAQQWNEQRQLLLENNWQWPEECPPPASSQSEPDGNVIISSNTQHFCEGLLQGWSGVLEDWQTLLPENTLEGQILKGTLMAMSILYDPEAAIDELQQHGLGANDIAQFKEIYESLPIMMCGLTIKACQVASTDNVEA